MEWMEELMTCIFRATWQGLSEKGHCDALDGVQFNRVFNEWVAAGYKIPLIPFIREAANRPA